MAWGWVIELQRDCGVSNGTYVADGLRGPCGAAVIRDSELGARRNIDATQERKVIAAAEIFSGTSAMVASAYSLT